MTLVIIYGSFPFASFVLSLLLRETFLQIRFGARMCKFRGLSGALQARWQPWQLMLYRNDFKAWHLQIPHARTS